MIRLKKGLKFSELLEYGIIGFVKTKDCPTEMPLVMTNLRFGLKDDTLPIMYNLVNAGIYEVVDEKGICIKV